MRVLNVAFPFSPVGPDAVGGAEQIVHALDSMLSRMGEGSFVLAAATSVVAGRLIANEPAEGDANGIRDFYESLRRKLEAVIADLNIDLVHFHGVDFFQYLPEVGIPSLVTLHLPRSYYPEDALRFRPRTILHCVSKSQQSTFETGPQFMDPIANGVDPTLASSGSEAAREYAACLGRICPEKGYHLALEAVTRAGLSFRLAGQVFPYRWHEAYFEREILPRLDHKRMFAGPIGRAEKGAFLGSAICLLVPSLVEETSSLVAMEALACGTPVIAHRIGALADLVDHGRTGFLVDNVEEMSEALLRVHEIDPDACRQAAVQRFSRVKMEKAYFQRYKSLIAT